MRKFVGIAGLAAIFLLGISAAMAAAPRSSKGASGAIVIVFKDGHRQTFNLSDIERVEFPAPAVASVDSGSGNSQAPPRGHYVGKWECGDGAGNTFYITLKENGDASKSIGGAHGHWDYVNGEAQISWEDGWRDVIRKAGSRYQKSAYSKGRSLTDAPDNVTDAHLTAPKPI